MSLRLLVVGVQISLSKCLGFVRSRESDQAKFANVQRSETDD